MPERRFPVSGEVDMASTEELQNELLVLINATNDDLVIDCAGLEFIDSTGIGVFIHTMQLLDVQGRRFRVVNLNGMARRAFEVLGLTEMLGITDTESV